MTRLTGFIKTPLPHPRGAEADHRTITSIIKVMDGLVAPNQRNSSLRRQVTAFVIALIAWILVASVLNRLLRITVPGYAAAEPGMDFTLSMQCARLALGAAASLSAGFILARLAPNGRWLPLIFGALLFAMFLPEHYKVWDKFPIWYHLLFLLTIVPLVVAGARIGAQKASVVEP